MSLGTTETNPQTPDFQEHLIEETLKMDSDGVQRESRMIDQPYQEHVQQLENREMDHRLKIEVYKHYRILQGMAQQGWRQSITTDERAHTAVQFFTSARVLKPDSTGKQVVRSAVHLEMRTFTESQTKNQYLESLKEYLARMRALRDKRLQTQQVQAQQQLEHQREQTQTAQAKSHVIQ